MSLIKQVETAKFNSLDNRLKNQLLNEFRIFTRKAKYCKFPLRLENRETTSRYPSMKNRSELT